VIDDIHIDPFGALRDFARRSNFGFNLSYHAGSFAPLAFALLPMFRYLRANHVQWAVTADPAADHDDINNWQLP
jgi:hypothetical protein